MNHPACYKCWSNFFFAGSNRGGPKNLAIDWLKRDFTSCRLLT